LSDTLLFSLLAGFLGLIVGSFLNVCISRLPEDCSVVAPRSHCPRCGSFIAWYDNLPVLSFISLGGRCRNCRAQISFRYPIVELLTGALFFYVQWRLGLGWAALKWFVFAAIVVELIFSDAETRILPDEFTRWGAALGVIFSPIVHLPYGMISMLTQWILPGESPALASFINSAGSAILLSGGLWLMGAAYARFRGREGLGFGDVKMVAFMGAFMGLETTLLALMIGSLLGSVMGLIWIKIRGEDTSTYELPFGSFLGAGALIAAVMLLQSSTK